MIARAALLALLLFALATPVAAQHGHLFRGPTQRAIHAQLMESDLVAIGTVEDVGLGRIRFGDLRPLVGNVDVPLEVKRAPSRAPGLHPGERILLILRGARTPYLLVPTNDEVLRIDSAETEIRTAGAIHDLHGVLSQPDELQRRYQTWLTGPDDDLRRLAEVALTNPSQPLSRPLRSYFLGLAALASDPAQRKAVRRAAARVAGSDEHGVAALLAALPGEEPDAALLLDVLRLGALRGSPEATSTLVRSLRHPDAEIRRTALGLGPMLTRDPTLRAEVERVAEEDASESLRSEAAALVRAQDPRPGEDARSDAAR